MAQPGKQFKLRLPDELHAHLTTAAKCNGRSVGSEITIRLRRSLSPDWRAEPPKESTADWWGQAQNTAENFS